MEKNDEREEYTYENEEREELTEELLPYYNYTCQPEDCIKTCTVPSPQLNEHDLEKEKRLLEI